MIAEWDATYGRAVADTVRGAVLARYQITFGGSRSLFAVNISSPSSGLLAGQVLVDRKRLLIQCVRQLPNSMWEIDVNASLVEPDSLDRVAAWARSLSRGAADEVG